MGEGIGKKFLKKYGKELAARERGHVANDASGDIDGVETLVPITPEDVARYTLPDTAPSTPEELEKEQSKENGAEWIRKIRESLKEKGAYQKPINYTENPPNSKDE